MGYNVVRYFLFLLKRSSAIHNLEKKLHTASATLQTAPGGIIFGS